MPFGAGAHLGLQPALFIVNHAQCSPKLGLRIVLIFFTVDYTLKYPEST